LLMGTGAGGAVGTGPGGTDGEEQAALVRARVRTDDDHTRAGKVVGW
jgi:hypothetical protein